MADHPRRRQPLQARPAVPGRVLGLLFAAALLATTGVAVAVGREEVGAGGPGDSSQPANNDPCPMDRFGGPLEPSVIWPDTPLPDVESLADALALVGFDGFPIPEAIRDSAVELTRDSGTGSVRVAATVRRDGTFDEAAAEADAITAAGHVTGNKAEGSSGDTRFLQRELTPADRDPAGDGDKAFIAIHSCVDRPYVALRMVVTIGPEHLGDCAPAARLAACRALYATDPDLDNAGDGTGLHQRVTALPDRRLQLSLRGLTFDTINRGNPSWDEERLLGGLIDEGWTPTGPLPCHLDVGMMRDDIIENDSCPPFYDPGPPVEVPRSHQLQRTFDSGVTVIYDLTLENADQDGPFDHYLETVTLTTRDPV